LLIVNRHEPRGRDAQRAKRHVRGTGHQVTDDSVPLDLLRAERTVRDQIQVKVELQVFGHFFQQVYGKPETTVRLRQRPTHALLSNKQRIRRSPICTAIRSRFVRVQFDVLEDHRDVVFAGGRHLIALNAPETLPVPLQRRVHDERRPDGGHHSVYGSSSQPYARHHFPARPHHRVQLDQLSARAERTDRADFFPRSRVSV